MKRYFGLKHRLGLIASTLLFLVFGFLWSQEKPSGAYVQFVFGKAYVKHDGKKDGKWIRIKKEDRIQKGDTVQVGNGSRVTILYKGSEFKLYPNTKVNFSSFEPKEKGSNLYVQSGFAWFHLINLNGKRFQAETPLSTAGVRGTKFSALYDKKADRSMNCICEGKVEVASLDNPKETKMVVKGSGSDFSSKKGSPNISNYEGEIDKLTALPAFQKKIKEFPLMKNCISCHKPVGWKMPDRIVDETYGG